MALTRHAGRASAAQGSPRHYPKRRSHSQHDARCISTSEDRRHLRRRNIASPTPGVDRCTSLERESHDESTTGYAPYAPPSTAKRRKTADSRDTLSNIHPDWCDPRIPFDCWVDVFHFATAICKADGSSNSWLVHAATACHILAEPALTALYRCPHIKNHARAKRLAALLNRHPADMMFNYRAKVESLHIDIHVVPQAIMFDLIHPLTRLKELIIFTTLDQAPYRQLESPVRWRYPESIFRALDRSDATAQSHIDKPMPNKLKSWEWSGRLLGDFVPSIKTIASLHQQPTFSCLSRLSLTNFQVPSSTQDQFKTDSEEMQMQHADDLVVDDVARAISQLKSLKHLVFESSTVVNDRLLSSLPSNLLHLELINCWEVCSDGLAAYLRSYGNSMRALTLAHNQSLDLAFLADLSESCPELRELHINMSYFRHHTAVNDADPFYNQALLPSQVPRWPTSIRVINIENVSNWTAETAEMCFQSLLDSAADLTELRHLTLKTKLDIPWQARATMRREWREKLERVFLRPLEDPKSYPKLPPSSINGASSVQKRRGNARSIMPSRRSGRIAAAVFKFNTHALGSRKALRNQTVKPTYRDPDTDEDEIDSPTSGDEDEEDHTDPADSPLSSDHDEFPYQGRCETVNIICDNQKVSELQYGMEDFLDEDEQETEDEWDGDDDSVIAF